MFDVTDLTLPVSRGHVISPVAVLVRLVLWSCCQGTHYGQTYVIRRPSFSLGMSIASSLHCDRMAFL